MKTNGLKQCNRKNELITILTNKKNPFQSRETFKTGLGVLK